MPLGLLLLSCFALSPSQGGSVSSPPPPRVVDAKDVLLPDGFAIEVVATGLTFPTGVTFDDEGTPYVVESGYSYGEVFLDPRIVRVGDDGALEEVVRGGHPPWTGATWHRGGLLVAQGGEIGGGRIVWFGPAGEREVLVDGLPTLGDHHTDGVVVGPDGAIWFATGTATNSGVVGPDNARFGWLKRHPGFHDTPCEDVVLAGVDYTSEDPLSGEGTVRTGAFVPYGTPTEPGQVIPGAIPCNGALFRLPEGSTEPELVAWGFRNPFGLAFGPDGALYVTDNGFDVRGSRPVFGAGDWLWRVEPGTWYGWPDYAGGRGLDDPWFAAPGEDVPRALLAKPPMVPPDPVARFPVHSSADGIDFAPGGAFGEHAYVALFGDMAPEVGKVLDPVGFSVVRVDVETGAIETFAANGGKKVGPASWLRSGGLERPVAVRFDPSGEHLYVVDFGIVAMGEDGPVPQPGTGVLWRVSSTSRPVVTR